MNKRGVEIDCSKLPNASPKPKGLHLKEDDSDGLFHCLVQGCKHDGFTTQRGCRKHAKNKHRWYFYFGEKPNITQTEACQQQSNKNDANDDKASLKASLCLLICQSKSPKISCPGLLPVVVVVKAIGKHNKLSAVV